MVANAKHVVVSILVIALSSAMTGCAGYRKCGFSGCPGDAEISAEVRSLFGKHSELGPSASFHIQTIDRTVYLNGLVDTEFERRNAEAIALQAANVKEVINSIGIRNAGR
jgi:osmotically-inducible protein OsmY